MGAVVTEQVTLEHAADLPAPEALAQEIMDELESALSDMTMIVEALGGEAARDG